jgi:hypothetical protein
MQINKRSLGSSGLQITTVGFGSWAIGGGGWTYGSRVRCGTPVSRPRWRFTRKSYLWRNAERWNSFRSLPMVYGPLRSNNVRS